MNTGTELSCKSPDTGAFEVRSFPRKPPKKDMVEVAVEAASVNPIDVRRAGGYGRRLLSLLGAGKFPMVLGNDFAGIVSAIGPDVTSVAVGDRVFGVRKPSRHGTHASHTLVKATPATLASAPDGHDLQALSVLPYSFTTIWLAVRGAGLTRANAAGRRVLVHGAAGGLGTLALQMLSDWGAQITAIARPGDTETCLALGAAEAIDLVTHPFDTLGRSFDATLNFATWDHDRDLLGCLSDSALGHATTVHPLMKNFDEGGYIGGAIRTVSDKRRSRAALPVGVSRYEWTLFQPKAKAMAELKQFIAQGRADLAIGLRVPLKDGAQAFDHVRSGQPGRAVILP